MSKPHEMNIHKPLSVYALAVSKSGFGRVCPRCQAKWSDKAKFIADNEMIGLHDVPLSVSDRVGNGFSMISIRQHIYRHSCGGEMLIDVYSEDSSAHTKSARRGFSISLRPKKTNRSINPEIGQ